MARQLTPADKRRAVTLWHNGYTKRAIAKKLKCSEATIYRVLNAYETQGTEIPRLVDGNKDGRSNTVQQQFFDESPPPKVYVYQLYPIGDQKAYREGTLTPERATWLADNLPTLRALQDFEVYCDLYEATKLAPHQRDWIKHMMSHQDAAVFAPPGAGKSYLFSVFLQCWVLAGGGHEREFYLNPSSPLRNAKILMVSESEEQAKKNIRGIQGRLDAKASESRLVKDFGRFRDVDQMWQTSRLDVAGRERSKLTGDASLVGVGVGTNFLGFRADWTICDDFASPDNCKTPERVDEIMQWMGDKVFTRSERNARTFIIMARLPLPNDPSVRIERMGAEEDDEEGERVFSVMVSPAVRDYATKEMLWGDEAQAATYNLLSWKQLMNRRSKLASRDRFETIYNQVPYAYVGALVRREWIYGEGTSKGCLDLNRGLSVSEEVFNANNDPVPTIRVMSLDPSPTKFAGALVMDIPLFGREVYAPQLLDIERERMTSPTMIALMREWFERYKFRVLLFEQNAAQRWLMENPDWQAFQRWSGVKLIAHQTTGANKPDEKYGVQTLADDFMAGNIRIPYGDAEARAKFNILIREALEEVNTNDTLMALWFPKWHLGGLNMMKASGGWPGYRGGVRGPVSPPPRLMKAVS